MSKADDDQIAKKSPPRTPAFKKRHRGCSFCILDLEKTPIPEFPPNQEAVGVITMEDVIEELLQVHKKKETQCYVLKITAQSFVHFIDSCLLLYCVLSGGDSG